MTDALRPEGAGAHLTREVSTGTGDDIDRATHLARRMVKECGMSERLGPVAFGRKQHLSFLGRDVGEQRNYSDKVGDLIDQEIRRLIDEGYTRALSILRDHREALDRVALELARAETMDAPALQQIFSS